MLSLEEIRDSKINIQIAREAYNQADKRLADILSTKEAFEQKAFTLFGGYMTALLGLFTAAGVLYEQSGINKLSISFLLSGAMVLLGVLCFVSALKGYGYGAAGSNPGMWLTKNIIDGDDDALPYMLACIIFHHQKRIKVSIESNRKKHFWISLGIAFGIASPIMLLLILCF